MDTLLKMAQDVQRFFDLANEASDSIDMLLAREVVNRAHQRRCTENKWKFMLSREYSLAVVQGQQEYVLPHTNFDRINYLFSTTQGCFKKLTPTTELPSNVAYDVTLNSDSAAAREFQIFPDAALHSPFDEDGVTLELEIFGSEDAGKQLYVEGLDENGNEVSETVTAVYTGPSGPNIAAFANIYTKITYYAKSEDFNSDLSINLTGADTVINLTSTEYMKKYPVLKFVGVPTQAESCVYRYYRQPRVLSRDFDTFDIPFPHSGIILYDALLDLATYSELDSESVNIWRDKQQEYLGNLYLNQLEGDAVGGRTPHTQEPMY